MLKIGKKPKLSFKIDALVDGKSLNTRFSDLIDGPTVVSVYMRNNTSSCDKQTDSLSKSMQTIVNKGFKLITISRDTCASHLKYRVKNGFKFTMVADPEDLFSQALDAVVEKSMYGKKYFGPTRAAYIFDGKGKLVGLIPKVESEKHGVQVLEAIQELSA